MTKHTTFKCQNSIQTNFFCHKEYIAICCRSCQYDLSQVGKSICHKPNVCYSYKMSTSQHNSVFLSTCVCNVSNFSYLVAWLLPQAVGFLDSDTCTQLESVKLFTQLSQAVQWKLAGSLFQTILSVWKIWVTSDERSCIFGRQFGDRFQSELI